MADEVGVKRLGGLDGAGPIGVGIVGLSANGGWAANAHVPALRTIRTDDGAGYEVRALSASSRESAEAAGRAYGVPLTFGTAGELAAHPDVDLVVVTVKVPHHRELVPGLPPEHPGYAVAHAYVQLLDDQRTGRRTVPDFDHAVRRHRTLGAIEDAARHG